MKETPCHGQNTQFSVCPIIRFLLTLAVAFVSTALSGQNYIWQQPQATVLESGDLQWNPEALTEFDPASYVGDIRYIDYENGDDANDGGSTSTAWKHHPWDWYAAGNAAAHSGTSAYVFKKGVIYRAAIKADESGTDGDPIILTSISSWGTGDAWIVGSSKLPSNWVPADTISGHPARIPEIDKVYAIDMVASGFRPVDSFYLSVVAGPYAPSAQAWKELKLPYIGMWRVNSQNDVDQLHVARTPDWEPGDDNYALDYWHQWQERLELSYSGATTKMVHDDWLMGHPADYFVGGYMWKQYPSFMGTPTPSLIEETFEGKDDLTGDPVTIPTYDPVAGAMRVTGMGGIGAGNHYMIEHLPQFLDSAGEFYYDTPNNILYYRPADGVDPNDEHLELVDRLGMVILTGQSHIEVSNLRFSFATTAVSTYQSDSYDSATDINVHHSKFDNIMNYAVNMGQSNLRSGSYADRLRVADCEFTNLWGVAIDVSSGLQTAANAPDWDNPSRIGDMQLLRNRIYNTGERHSENAQSPVPAVNIRYTETATVAGNIVERTFGSGIMVFGGRAGRNVQPVAHLDLPFTRYLIFNNKTEDNARGVNDYGGMSLWQSGASFCFNNLIGNSPGHMPAGIFGEDTLAEAEANIHNLSYPLYLDGAFKQYSFNNIIWGRTSDPDDLYRNMNQAYFMVFGFTNEFNNNTIYNFGEAMGGSSGARQNVQGNLFSDITNNYFRHAHGALPSQIGGGDANDTAGVASLAYENNAFFGSGEAGSLAAISKGADADIIATTFPEMQQQMEDYPIRLSGLGLVGDESLIAYPSAGPVDDLSTSNVDFRPAGGSVAIDNGGTTFVPWGLYGTVGEWQFNKNLRDPAQVIDYHWYMSSAHSERSMYHYIPQFILTLSDATVADYVASESEDWVEGAMTFDGNRYGTVTDAQIKEDILINILDYTADWTDKDKKNTILRMDERTDIPWTADDPSGGYDGEGNPIFTSADYVRFPGAERKTPEIRTENVLVETIVKVNSGSLNQAIVGKHDGSTGYRMYVNGSGNAVFEISQGGSTDQVVSAASVNTGNWVHILAEVDRTAAGNTMTIYIDGTQDGQATGSITDTDSLVNNADFIVGANNNLGEKLIGAMDFLRICHGTLADAKTDIAELYAWQTAGPARYDYMGNSPVGQRDAGAIEGLNPYSASRLAASYEITNDTVTLTWQDNSTGDDSVIIERSTSEDFSGSVTSWTLNGADLTSFVDDTAGTGTVYYYRVKVKAGSDKSPWSHVLKVAIGTEAPEIPSDIGFEVDGTDIKVEWDNPEPTNTFKQPSSWTVKWTTTSGSSYSSTTGLTETKHTITGVDPATITYVVIEAVNGVDTTASAEYAVIDYTQDFSGVADGSLPNDWTASSTASFVEVSPTGFTSPTGTPMLLVVDKGMVHWTPGLDMQNYQIEAVLLRADSNPYARLGVNMLYDTTAGLKGLLMMENIGYELDVGDADVTYTPDSGETTADPGMDVGEAWTLKMMVAPTDGNSTTAVDVYVQLYDEAGNDRIDGTDSAISEKDGDWYVLRGIALPASGTQGTLALVSSLKKFYIDSVAIKPFVTPGVTFDDPAPILTTHLLELDMRDGNASISSLSVVTVENISGSDITLTGKVWMAAYSGTTVDINYDSAGGTNYSSAWVTSVNVPSVGSFTQQEIDLGSDLTIPAGATYTFQVTATSGRLVSKYFSAQLAEDDNLRVSTSIKRAIFGQIEYATGSGGGIAVIAVDDGDSVDEGSSTIVDVLANDTNATQIDSFTQGTSGTVSQSGTDLIYTPFTGVWSGSDVFNYTAGDGSSSDTAAVDIVINAINGSDPLTDNVNFDTELAFRSADGQARERSDGSYEIAAFGGAGISTDSSGDEFLFVKGDISGDFQVSVQVKSIDGPTGSFAGVMIRDGSDTDGTNDTLEKMAFEASEKGTLYLSQERTSAGSGAAVAVTSQISGTDVSHSEPEKWVMIERSGVEIIYYTGEDDGTGNIVYTEVDASPVTLTGLSDTVQVGLFTISGDGTSNATAVFDNYAVTATSVIGSQIVDYQLDTGSVASSAGLSSDTDVTTSLSSASDYATAPVSPAFRGGIAGPTDLSLVNDDTNGDFLKFKQHPIKFTGLAAYVAFWDFGSSASITEVSTTVANNPWNQRPGYLLVLNDGTYYIAEFSNGDLSDTLTEYVLDEAALLGLSWQEIDLATSLTSAPSATSSSAADILADAEGAGLYYGTLGASSSIRQFFVSEFVVTGN